MYSLVTIIVPATQVVAARQIALECDQHGLGMFTTELSSTGQAPATHYISSGYITEPPFISALANGEILHNLAVVGAAAQGIAQTSTLAEANALVTSSVVHTGVHPTTGLYESVFDLLSRLGYQLVNSTQP